jgi:outer membrane protein TolC
MGMPQENELDIVEIENFPEFDTYETIKGGENFFENRVDYRLLKTALSMQKSEKSLYVSQYIPSLSLTYNYGYQAQTNFFDDITKGDNWFASSSIALSLNVPIFSSFQRWFRVSQANTNIRKLEEGIATSVEGMKVEANNYGSQYINAFENMKNEKENLNLAEEVYKSTHLDYDQGRASALDIIQAETSYTESQNNYYSKLLSLYLARLDIEQSKGNVINFINNLK